MRTMTYWLIPLLMLLALAAMSCASHRPIPSGLDNGRLSPCPKSPNCVSSEEPGKKSFIEPFEFKDNPADSWTLLKQIILDMGGKVEKENDHYLWAIFKTKVFRFVDDVEFRLDEDNKIIHVRSAARTGYSDFGVNRKRIETIRLQYERDAEPWP